MNVLVGLLVCCLFHARSAHLNKRFNQREAKQRALCSRVLPALNTFAAIGHEQSVVVMAALCSFCLSRFGGKLLLSRCLLVHYQRNNRRPKRSTKAPVMYVLVVRTYVGSGERR